MPLIWLPQRERPMEPFSSYSSTIISSARNLLLQSTNSQLNMTGGGMVEELTEPGKLEEAQTFCFNLFVIG